MATQVASLYGVLSIDDSDWNKKLKDADKGFTGLGSRVSSVGDKIAGFGAKMTVFTAPLAVGLGTAVKSAMDFDEAMTNVGAVLGRSAADMKPLNAQILAMGANSLAGPQKVAEAFYDVVGGVADASTHMAILEAAIATSEAGAAELGSTTAALIAVMNSYGFSADEAAYASDVLTRTVGMGVGSMNDFAAALPQVTGLANSLGISFGDVGAMAGYLTTQGNSASQATTQLGAMMTSLLNPNETMKKALQELGFASGEAAIKQLGLAGAFQAIAGTTVVAENGMAKAAGSVEALRGATALGGPAFQEYADTFVNGINGATQAARDIQLESATAKFATLQSQMSAMAIEIGNVVLPALLALVEEIKPVIGQVMEWMKQNPEATKTIVALTGAVVILGPIITALGVAISAAGTIITGATAIVGVFGTGLGALSGFAGAATVSIAALISPILAVTAAAVAAVAALKAVIDFHNQVSAAAGQAQADVAKLQSGGANITRQQLDDQAFKSVAGQFGGGVLGDVAARLTYSNFADATQGNTAMESGRVANNGRGNLSLPGRDSGGMGVPGQPYMIGTGAQPEVFIPSSAGTFVPNADQQMGETYNVTIYANDAAGGAAAGDAFEQKMRERRRSRG